MWFDVNPWLGALLIPMIIVLTPIAANATGLTSTTPTGSLSKITQFTFGSIAPIGCNRFGEARRGPAPRV